MGIIFFSSTSCTFNAKNALELTLVAHYTHCLSIFFYSQFWGMMVRSTIGFWCIEDRCEERRFSHTELKTN
jgi:hypothetical protein